MLTKDEVLNQMTESPDSGGELNYPLTDHIGIHIVSILFRNEKWYLNVWNDYHDCTACEYELSESDALEYLTYDINKNKTPELDSKVLEDLEDLESGAEDSIFDEAEVLANRIRKHIQKQQETERCYKLIVGELESELNKYNGLLKEYFELESKVLCGKAANNCKWEDYQRYLELEKILKDVIIKNIGGNEDAKV